MLNVRAKIRSTVFTLEKIERQTLMSCSLNSGFYTDRLLCIWWRMQHHIQALAFQYCYSMPKARPPYFSVVSECNPIHFANGVLLF